MYRYRYCRIKIQQKKDKVHTDTGRSLFAVGGRERHEVKGGVRKRHTKQIQLQNPDVGSSK